MNVIDIKMDGEMIKFVTFLLHKADWFIFDILKPFWPLYGRNSSSFAHYGELSIIRGNGAEGLQE